jgi:hypothetical protein
MSAPSPNEGKLGALLGNCDQTGVSSSDKAKRVTKGFLV